MNYKEHYLFKLDRNDRLRLFHLKAAKVEDGAVLISIKGLLHGIHQEDREIIYPKNVGRANETTPFQQAVLEMESKVNKLLDKGYLLIDDWEDYTQQEIYEKCYAHLGLDASGNLAPMLAQKDANKIRFPGFVQPKVNGLRGFFERVNGGIQFRSRRGKIFHTLDHLIEPLMNLPRGWIIDGEIYRESTSLQKIQSLAKRKQPESGTLQYMIFDVYQNRFPNMAFHARFTELKEFYYLNIPKEYRDKLVLVDTRIVREERKLTHYYGKWLARGWEGLMWRDPNGKYEPGVRSYGLIKFKPTFDEEFEIVDVEEATGRDIGTAVLVLKTKDGNIFNSRPKGTREERAYYWNHKEEIIGKKAKVIYDELSDNGIPLRSRVEAIRELWD